MPNIDPSKNHRVVRTTSGEAMEMENDVPVTNKEVIVGVKDAHGIDHQNIVS